MESDGKAQAMKNQAKIQNLERDVEQLRRALTNQNLVASQQGSRPNRLALERIENKQKEIESLQATAPKKRSKAKKKKK